jgi:geranylgeranyl diphosphate synthase type 3
MRFYYVSFNSLDILKQRTSDVDLKKHAIQLMKETGSFEYARNVLDTLKNDILKEIAVLGGNNILEGMRLLL